RTTTKTRRNTKEEKKELCIASCSFVFLRVFVVIFPDRSRSQASTFLRFLRLPHMHPGMHVRCAAEIPDHRRPLDLPYVPDAVTADIHLGIERHVQLIEPGGFDQLHRLVGVRLAEGG